MINKKLAQMMVEKPIKADVSNTESKLYLYGTIGSSWGGVTLDDVKDTAKDMDKSKVTVYINSYGGDATEGVAIRNFLKETFSHIDVVIDGIAASAASVIATCGDTLSMPTGTTYMIHNPLTYAMGNKKDFEQVVEMLDSMERSYRNIYMERFTGTEDELIQLMDDESWLTAEEAQLLGFATQKEAASDDAEEPIVESELVAKLVAKYAEDTNKVVFNNGVDDGTINTEDENKDENLETDKEKPNNLLQNFAKVFSNFE